jgi:putative glutamine amidotransferase
MVSGARDGAVLVGVTTRRLADGRVQGWNGDGIGERANYLGRVRAAGAIPVLLDPADERDVEPLLTRLDAVLLTGGPDVAPDRYRAQEQSVYGVDPVVDAFELALARDALSAEVPLLAICRGIQVLNVAFGGTLHQHVPDLPGVEAHGRPGERGGQWCHTVAVEPSSRLAAVMGTSAPTCSCHHHQSIDAVGSGWRVVAQAADGIVEAIEPDDAAGAPAGFVLAVQWHPEDTAPTDPAQQQLFDALVAAGASVRSRS